jgi:hypothetical protein
MRPAAAAPPAGLPASGCRDGVRLARGRPPPGPYERLTRRVSGAYDSFATVCVTQWGYSQGFICEVSTDPTGRFLLAAVTPDVNQPSTLIGLDLRTGASETLPVHPDLPFRGTQLAW